MEATSSSRSWFGPFLLLTLTLVVSGCRSGAFFDRVSPSDCDSCPSINPPYYETSWNRPPLLTCMPPSAGTGSIIEASHHVYP